MWCGIAGTVVVIFCFYLPGIDQEETAYRIAPICDSGIPGPTCRQRLPAQVTRVEDINLTLYHRGSVTTSHRRIYTLGLTSGEAIVVELSDWPEFEKPINSFDPVTFGIWSEGQQVVVEKWRGEAVVILVGSSDTKATEIATTHYPLRVFKEKRDSALAAVLLCIGFGFSITLGLGIERMRVAEMNT